MLFTWARLHRSLFAWMEDCTNKISPLVERVKLLYLKQLILLGIALQRLQSLCLCICQQRENVDTRKRLFRPACAADQFGPILDVLEPLVPTGSAFQVTSDASSLALVGSVRAPKKQGHATWLSHCDIMCLSFKQVAAVLCFLLNPCASKSCLMIQSRTSCRVTTAEESCQRPRYP